MQFLGIRVLLKRGSRLFSFMMADKTVPKRKKALIVFGIIYLFSTYRSYTADTCFRSAWIDDFAAVAVYSLSFAADELDSYWTGGKTKDFSKKYRGQNLCG